MENIEVKVKNASWFILQFKNFEAFYLFLSLRGVAIEDLDKKECGAIWMTLKGIAYVVMSNTSVKDYANANEYITKNEGKVKALMKNKELPIKSIEFNVMNYESFEEFEEDLLTNNIKVKELKGQDKINYELIKMKIDKSMLSNLKYLGYNIKEYKAYASTYLDKYIDREDTGAIKAIVYKELLPRK